VLFGQCPGGRTEAAVKALADVPAEMGFSYPCNAGWRLWALGKAGRADVILNDFRQRWATMGSVILNNTLQEDWNSPPDSGAQWSHCAVVPLYVLYMSIAGIRPLSPGFSRFEIRPQLADLEQLDLVAHTVRGPIRLESRGRLGDRELQIGTPPNCEAELLLPRDEQISLPAVDAATPPGLARYHLPTGQTTILRVQRI
jgi:hypothetical protein